MSVNLDSKKLLLTAALYTHMLVTDGYTTVDSSYRNQQSLCSVQIPCPPPGTAVTLFHIWHTVGSICHADG